MKHALEMDTRLLIQRPIPVHLAKKLQEAMDCFKRNIFNRPRNEEHKNVRAAFVKHMYMLCKLGCPKVIAMNRVDRKAVGLTESYCQE